jgi:hypothetical protein
MKDTIRLIMFLECNFRCRYCCNDKTQFNQLFIEKSLAEIDFRNYNNICITGGEPFLRKDVFYEVLYSIPADKPIYLYTNGILITEEDIGIMSAFENIKGINIGLHGVNQLKLINPLLDELFSVRYMGWNKYEREYREKYPNRLNENNTKFWELDNCLRENEDWVLLTDFEEGYGIRK